MVDNQVPLPTQAAKTSFKMINTSDIDDPQRAMRKDLTSESVADLAQSIAQIGIVEPLVVQPTGDRFEVIAGHRRLTAATLAGVGLVPCYIVEGTQEQIEMMKIHENLYRVEVPPLDEAEHYQRIIKDMKLSPSKIAQLIGRGERYVTDRLRLLRLPEPLKQALVTEQVNMSVALELGRIEDPIKLGEMLSYVRGSAISTATAKRWVDEQLTKRDEPVAGIPEPPAENHVPDPQGPHVNCFFCLKPSSIMDSTTVWVHDVCISERQKLVEEEQLEQATERGTVPA